MRKTLVIPTAACSLLAMSFALVHAAPAPASPEGTTVSPDKTFVQVGRLLADPANGRVERDKTLNWPPSSGPRMVLAGKSPAMRMAPTVSMPPCGPAWIRSNTALTWTPSPFA